MRLFALFLFLTNIVSILFLVWTILLTVVFEWDLHECELGCFVSYKHKLVGIGRQNVLERGSIYSPYNALTYLYKYR